MKVMKFGGTSLANWERFSAVAQLAAEQAQSEGVALVLSAPATATNALIELVELAKGGQEYAVTLARVESLFGDLFAAALQDKALDLDGFEALQQQLVTQVARWRNLLNGISFTRCLSGSCVCPHSNCR